jgi:CubicO group peptidase (beta-lactamase class C family)
LCQENLIHTPLCFEPGTSFQYGNSFDWLGLMLPHLTGTSSEDYLQDNILKPLGLKATTFFPFGPDWNDRLMPLRWRRSDGVFQAIDRKSPAAMLMLPRK